MLSEVASTPKTSASSRRPATRSRPLSRSSERGGNFSCSRSAFFFCERTVLVEGDDCSSRLLLGDEGTHYGPEGEVRFNTGDQLSALFHPPRTDFQSVLH